MFALKPQCSTGQLMEANSLLVTHSVPRLRPSRSQPSTSKPVCVVWPSSLVTTLRGIAAKVDSCLRPPSAVNWHMQPFFTVYPVTLWNSSPASVSSYMRDCSSGVFAWAFTACSVDSIGFFIASAMSSFALSAPSAATMSDTSAFTGISGHTPFRSSSFTLLAVPPMALATCFM